MDGFRELLEQVSGKIQELGERLKEEKRKSARLESENQRLRALVQQHTQDTTHKTTQLRGMLSHWQQEDPQLAEEFRMEIGRHISRIDNCIKWLEQQ